MAGVSGIGTTFNLPNFHGQLFSVTPDDTPLLSAIGGLTGGQQSDSTAFEWQTDDLRAPAQPAVLEGATAPTAQERARANVSNVVQIHHEKVEVSYTKQAAMGQYATPGSAPYRSMSGAGADAVINELDYQLVRALKTVALDVNFSFINGLVNVPTTNAAARKTKGLIQACTTNVTNKGTALTGASASTDTITVTHALSNGDKVVFTDVGASTAVVPGRAYFVVEKSTTVSFKVAETAGGPAITIGTATVSLNAASGTATDITVIEDFIQGVYDNGGLTSGMGTLLVSSSQKRALTAAYAGAYGKITNPVQGNVGGVNVTRLETDFGILNVMLDRHVPKDAIIVCSLDQLAPVFLNVPNKGVFFEEPLAKTGATDAVQIYGEIGLKWGNEKAHGVLRGLKI